MLAIVLWPDLLEDVCCSLFISLVQLPASPREEEKVSKKEHFMELCCGVSKLAGSRHVVGHRGCGH